MSFVYVIGSKGKPTVKIGKADDPIDRMAKLQTGNPDPLTIVRTYLSSDAGLLERWLHEKFKDEKHRGEWFTLASRLGDIDQAVTEFTSLNADERQSFEDRQSDCECPLWSIHEYANAAEAALHRAMPGLTDEKARRALIAALSYLDELKSYTYGH